MPELKARYQPTMRWTLVIIFIAGVLLLALRRFIPEIATWNRFNDSIQDLARDLGIAFVVSAIVARLYDMYLNFHNRIESMKDVIDAIMSEKLTREVWFELEDLIEKKTILRRDLRVRVETHDNDQLELHEAQLQVEIEYVVESIGKKQIDLCVQHDLDYHLARSDQNLPRFDHLTIVRMEKRNGIARAIEEKEFREEDLQNFNKAGACALKLKALRANEFLRVRVTREEIIHIPGSYNLYTTEFTKGLRVVVAKCPRRTRVELSVRPQGEYKQMSPAGDEWWTDELILPGQGVELKFIRDSQSPNCDMVQNQSSPVESIVGGNPASGVGAREQV